MQSSTIGISFTIIIALNTTKKQEKKILHKNPLRRTVKNRFGGYKRNLF